MGWFDGIPGLSQMESSWHAYNKLRGDITIINNSDLTLECYNNHSYQIDFWGTLNRTIKPGESFDFHIEFLSFPDTVTGDTAAESDYKVYYKGKEVGVINIYAKYAFIGTRTGKTKAYVLSSEPHINIYKKDERTVFKIVNGDLVMEEMEKEYQAEVKALTNQLQSMDDLLQNSQGRNVELLKERADLFKKLMATMERKGKSKYEN